MYSDECHYKNRMSQDSAVSDFSSVLHSALLSSYEIKVKVADTV